MDSWIQFRSPMVAMFHCPMVAISLLVVLIGLLPGMCLLNPTCANKVDHVYSSQGCEAPFDVRRGEQCCRLESHDESILSNGKVMISSDYTCEGLKTIEVKTTIADRIHGAHLGVFFLGKGPALFDYYIDDAHHVSVFEAGVIFYFVCLQLPYSVYQIFRKTIKMD
jgi:hypothetical protein